jgi:hypothetical protein
VQKMGSQTLQHVLQRIAAGCCEERSIHESLFFLEKETK